MKKRRNIYALVIILSLLYWQLGYRPISSISVLPLKYRTDYKKSDLIKQHEDSNTIISIYVNDNKNTLFTVVKKTILGYKTLVVSDLYQSNKVFAYHIINLDSNDLKRVYYGYINDSRVMRLDFCNDSNLTLYPIDNSLKVFFGGDDSISNEKQYTLYDDKNNVLLRLMNGELFNNLTP